MIGTAQREILDALIELYEKQKDSVKGEDISKMLKRSPGTIRNQMQTLRAMGYVEGVPGPKGGYSPSMKAYESLSVEPIENPHEVPIYRGGKKIKGVSAQKIAFTKVTHPSECCAIIRLMGDSRNIEDGDIIKVGPTPVNHIVIKGRVTGRDDTKREILVETHSITSIPKGKVGDIASRKLISFKPNMSISECGKTLIEKRINAAPVLEGESILGIIAWEEIVDACSSGKIKAKAKDIAVKEVFTVGKECKLLTCIKKMDKLNVGRLIVTDDGKPTGIITRTDILKRMID